MNLFRKQYLLLLVSFVAGFSIMTFEFTSARIITPFIGASVFTWTSVIGMILFGLSTGSYIGGYFIDKYKKENVLSFFLFLSSFSVAVVPFFANKSPYFVSLDLSILITAVLISFVLFFTPSLFLGLLYPAILKLYLRDIENLGKQYGVVSIFFTFGSILGTFLTGFYFIGKIGSSNTFFTISVVLFIFAVLFLFLNKHSLKYLIIIFTMAICLLLIIFCFNWIKNKNGNGNMVFSKETDYYKIKVVDRLLNFSNSRILFLDFDSHSVESKNREDLPVYTNIYPVFSVFNEKIKNIFVIGGGSYSIAKNFSKFYANSEVLVSELDPEVTKTAENFFNLKQYPISTISDDGRVYFQKTSKKYDLIFGDAYNSFISVPWHLSTLEFNELAKSHLKENGIYAVNFISALNGENSDFFKSMVGTFKKTFNNFYIFAYGATEEQPQSIILVGVNSNNKIEYQELAKKIYGIKNGEFLSRKIVQNELFKNSSDALILRDDFSPVESLMQPLINNYFKYYSTFYYSLI
jgi:predicted membrane-bound spermidine synthase